MQGKKALTLYLSTHFYRYRAMLHHLRNKLHEKVHGLHEYINCTSGHVTELSAEVIGMSKFAVRCYYLYLSCLVA